MGLSGSEIYEENHIVNGSWIAWLIDDSIGTILSVPFCPYHFVSYHFALEPYGTVNQSSYYFVWKVVHSWVCKSGLVCLHIDCRFWASGWNSFAWFGDSLHTLLSSTFRKCLHFSNDIDCAVRICSLNELSVWKTNKLFWQKRHKEI